MATINFPNNRDQLNPPLPTGALQDGDTTIINADGVDITYIFKKPGSPNTDSWWKSMGRVNNATPTDKIEEGNTSAEVIDTGTNGQFVVSTEGAARMKVTSDGTVKLNGSNIDTDPSVKFNPNGSAELGVNGSVNGRLNLRPNGTDTSLEVSSGSANGNIWTLSNNGTIVANSSANATNNPNYKLDATDGSASFDGEVTLEVTTGDRGLLVRGRQTEGQELGLFIDSVGSQKARLGISVTDDGPLLKTNNSANSGRDLNIEVGTGHKVNVDGAASFGDDVTVSSDGNIGNGAVLVKNYGEVQAIRPTGSTSAVFLGANGGTQTSWIYADGSASFSGGVTTVAPDGAVTVNKATYGTAFSIQGAGTTNAFIQSDGDSYFNQAVKVGNSYADPAAAIYADGTASFAGTITLTDGGEGILFPAANTGNADPNTLDDYEEGTFTPALTSNGGTDPTQSYQLQNGTYTKIGNIVHINVWIQFADSGITPGSGPAMVNIPFRGDNYGGGSLSWSKGWAAEPATHVQLDPNAPKVTLKKDLLQNSADCSNVQNGLLLNFTVVYKIK